MNIEVECKKFKNRDPRCEYPTGKVYILNVTTLPVALAREAIERAAEMVFKHTTKLDKHGSNERWLFVAFEGDGVIANLGDPPVADSQDFHPEYGFTRVFRHDTINLFNQPNGEAMRHIHSLVRSHEGYTVVWKRLGEGLDYVRRDPVNRPGVQRSPDAELESVESFCYSGGFETLQVWRSEYGWRQSGPAGLGPRGDVTAAHAAELLRQLRAKNDDRLTVTTRTTPDPGNPTPNT